MKQLVILATCWILLLLSIVHGSKLEGFLLLQQQHKTLDIIPRPVMERTTTTTTAKSFLPQLGTPRSPEWLGASSRSTTHTSKSSLHDKSSTLSHLSPDARELCAEVQSIYTDNPLYWESPMTCTCVELPNVPVDIYDNDVYDILVATCRQETTDSCREPTLVENNDSNLNFQGRSTIEWTIVIETYQSIHWKNCFAYTTLPEEYADTVICFEDFVDPTDPTRCQVTINDDDTNVCNGCSICDLNNYYIAVDCTNLQDTVNNNDNNGNTNARFTNNNNDAAAISLEELQFNECTAPNPATASSDTLFRAWQDGTQPCVAPMEETCNADIATVEQDEPSIRNEMQRISTEIQSIPTDNFCVDTVLAGHCQLDWTGSVPHTLDERCDALNLEFATRYMEMAWEMSCVDPILGVETFYQSEIRRPYCIPVHCADVRMRRMQQAVVNYKNSLEDDGYGVCTVRVMRDVDVVINNDNAALVGPRAQETQADVCVYLEYQLGPYLEYEYDEVDWDCTCVFDDGSDTATDPQGGRQTAVSLPNQGGLPVTAHCGYGPPECLSASSTGDKPIVGQSSFVVDTAVRAGSIGLAKERSCFQYGNGNYNDAFTCVQYNYGSSSDEDCQVTVNGDTCNACTYCNSLDYQIAVNCQNLISFDQKPVIDQCTEFEFAFADSFLNFLDPNLQESDQCPDTFVVSTAAPTPTPPLACAWQEKVDQCGKLPSMTQTAYDNLAATATNCPCLAFCQDDGSYLGCQAFQDAGMSSAGGGGAASTTCSSLVAGCTLDMLPNPLPDAHVLCQPSSIQDKELVNDCQTNLMPSVAQDTCPEGCHVFCGDTFVGCGTPASSSTMTSSSGSTNPGAFVVDAALCDSIQDLKGCTAAMLLPATPDVVTQAPSNSPTFVAANNNNVERSPSGATVSSASVMASLLGLGIALILAMV